MATSREHCLESLLNSLCSTLGTEVIEDGGSTEMGTPKLRSQRNGPNVPNDQLPVNPSRSDFTDRPTPPFIRPHARDGVLVHRKQLGFSLRTPTANTGARDTSGICVLEGVKSSAVQPPRSTRAESGRGKCRFWSRRVVKTSGELPSTFIP